MGPTGDRFRVIQVHPTRFCNLTCLHCYSSSGPDQKEELSAAMLIDALSDAAKEGYNDVGFSGGEPILYGQLGTLLSHSKSLGMATSVTSNGMLLEGKRLAMLEGHTDLLAISLDGPPESHNLMRNSPHAFKKMAANLEGVRRTGIPFGFIFTLTLNNLGDLKWVVDFALNEGATLLQIHPLEEVGRAQTLLATKRPDDVEAAFAYLETIRLQAAVGNRLAIRIDMVDRELLKPAPERVYADSCGVAAEDRRLSELISPLVVEQDGTVVPLQYGFDRRYQVGNLYNASLSRLSEEWKRVRLPAFQRLCKRVYDREVATSDLPIFNWYEAIAGASREPGELVLA